ncbi:c-type cytochrome [Candidatus Nitrosacidococcus sp. I8]|uniref:c-type cytochrome n=1 Tax=Candidatus Nitrosacidococcus sp. I8 TaxID=2942908 RepID=UPI002226B0D7|nr:cytochrome c [Candidatus Nitrosacidococcus sp. I8]CAH9019861.1 Cytochrome c4 [Candidatus Nitrosacidococcus sp. I8]
MSNRWLFFLLIPVSMVLASGTAMAKPKGDPTAGKQKSEACAGCHGADGNSPAPSFPKLAGQSANYIVHALGAYQSGDRKNDVMAGMAAPLSDQDKADLGAYFASQKGLNIPWVK